MRLTSQPSVFKRAQARRNVAKQHGATSRLPKETVGRRLSQEETKRLLAKFNRRAAQLTDFDRVDRSASRSQVKHRYGTHRQQPQNDNRNDVLDPFLIVREPSMMDVHGQPPSGYHAVGQNTLSHLRQIYLACPELLLAMKSALEQRSI